MHYHSTEKADLFVQNFLNPSKQAEQERNNKEVLRLIVTAVEFLAKQGLPFRGNRR